MASINKNKRGRWNAQIYLGRHPETGKTRWATKTFAAKREAERWATKIEGQRDEGTYKPTASKLTLGQYLEQHWLPSYRHQVRSTYNTEKTLGKWITTPRPNTPFLGKMPLNKLTVQHFKGLYTAMVEQGMGARGISHLHGILRLVLKTAVREGRAVPALRRTSSKQRPESMRWPERVSRPRSARHLARNSVKDTLPPDGQSVVHASKGLEGFVAASLPPPWRMRCVQPLVKMVSAARRPHRGRSSAQDRGHCPGSYQDCGLGRARSRRGRR